jgi:hypothetical protein
VRHHLQLHHALPGGPAATAAAEQAHIRQVGHPLRWLWQRAGSIYLRARQQRQLSVAWLRAVRTTQPMPTPCLGRTPAMVQGPRNSVRGGQGLCLPASPAAR